MSESKKKVELEKTSSVSRISYDLENANLKNYNREQVKEIIDLKQKNNKLPKNLNYIDSYTDKATGTTSVAFKDEKTNTVTIGMAGTNLPNDAVHDIGADAHIAFDSVTPKDNHYENTQKFIEKINKDYDVDTITGHSLGGRDAILIGINNDIDNIVVYNSAAIGYKELRKNKYAQNVLISPFQEKLDEANDDITEEIAKSCHGNILRINSSKDSLDKLGNKNLDRIELGHRITINNGKGHGINGFLGEKEQKIIKSTLKKIKNYKEATTKVKNHTNREANHKLSDINALKGKMIQQNGGALSSSQKKLIESMTAIAIAQSLKSSLESDMQILRQMYEEMMNQFREIWEDALEAADSEGSLLSNDEILNALEQGNVTETRIVHHPQDEIKRKLDKMNAVKNRYEAYISKFEDSIQQIVSKDQQLAAQIGVE